MTAPVAKNNSSAKLISSAGGKRDRNRMIAIQAGVAVVLVGLIAVIGVSIANKKSEKDAAADRKAAAAAGPAVYKDGDLRFGNQDAKIVLQVTEDLQCPACAMYQAQVGPYIEGLIKENKVAVDYRTIGWLNSPNNEQYSSRAANASACVAEADKAKWLPWTNLMFSKQPPESASGLPDSTIVDITKQAGVTSPQVAECITSGKYSDFITGVTNTTMKGGLQHTPTVKVNGTELKDTSPAGIKAAIEQAERVAK
ncbi:MAG: thioredoxin domain-containing protein [Mycobacteriaceae bacterium]|nr:thioredoxin domain-containing protein [Mycobacteriaceae bacterium]